MIPEKPRLRHLSASPSEAEGRPVVLVHDPRRISEHVATLSPPLASFLFEVLDGEHTNAEIRAEYARRSGGMVMPREELAGLLSQLDEACFLVSDRFRERYRRIVDEYRDAPVRPASLAGHAYPAEAAEATAFLDGLYEGVSSPESASPLQAVAIPHLDLRSGGTTAARGLAGLAERFSGDTIVILGVGHQLNAQPYALTGKDFETPLGTVPLHRELYDTIGRAVGGWVTEEEFVHRDEHSVEFAALLLRHALPDRDFRILPVLCGSLHGHLHDDVDPRQDPFVSAFIETLAEEAPAGEALIVASVDLAHMGPHYGDPMDLTEEDLKRIDTADREMLSLLAGRDPGRFFDHLRTDHDARRVCGMSALYTTLALLPDGPDGHLVEYAQPVFPQPGNTVTIASMTWSGP